MKRTIDDNSGTEELIGGLFEVQNQVGLGRREEAYHQAYIRWLTQQRVACHSKPPHQLKIGSEVAYILYPDFVTAHGIVIELKSLQRQFRDEERVQIFDYLKCSANRLGLLVNMGLDRVHVERIVYDRPDYVMEENWDCWTDRITGQDRDIGIRARQAVQQVFSHHGVGYGTEVTSHLLRCSVRQCGLTVRESPVAVARFHGVEVDNSPLDCWLLSERLVFVFTALFDRNDFNVSRGLSYMKTLGLEWGIAVNFGKRALSINGLCHSPKMRA